MNQLALIKLLLIKNKPHKWGIKVFACAGASRFVYGLDVYVGKKTISQPSELGISRDIVLKLAELLPPHKGFKISLNNWYASHGLVVALKEKESSLLGQRISIVFPGVR